MHAWCLPGLRLHRKCTQPSVHFLQISSRASTGRTNREALSKHAHDLKKGEHAMRNLESTGSGKEVNANSEGIREGSERSHLGSMALHTQHSNGSAECIGPANQAAADTTAKLLGGEEFEGKAHTFKVPPLNLTVSLPSRVKTAASGNQSAGSTEQDGVKLKRSQLESQRELQGQIRERVAQRLKDDYDK